MGFTYGLMAGSFGSITGATCNPARIFGPALVGKDLIYSLLLISGQLVGALLAGLTGEFILYKKEEADYEKTRKHRKTSVAVNESNRQTLDLSMSMDISDDGDIDVEGSDDEGSMDGGIEMV